MRRPTVRESSGQDSERSSQGLEPATPDRIQTVPGRVGVYRNGSSTAIVPAKIRTNPTSQRSPSTPPASRSAAHPEAALAREWTTVERRGSSRNLWPVKEPGVSCRVTFGEQIEWLTAAAAGWRRPASNLHPSPHRPFETPPPRPMRIIPRPTCVAMPGRARGKNRPVPLCLCAAWSPCPSGPMGWRQRWRRCWWRGSLASPGPTPGGGRT